MPSRHEDHRWGDTGREWAQCRGKIPYKSGQEAGRAKQGLAKRRREGMQIYRCPTCHHFHIGRPTMNGNPKERYRKFKNPPPIPDWA